MTEQNWQKIKDIFADALERPPGERDEFVRIAADGDAEIYDEVASLLAATEADEPILEKHGLNLAERANEPTPDYRERVFGNYRIIREIDSGGMGSVFLAERSDGAFAMQVALKIVRQSVADSEMLERFRQERQILASLHHPNIAALLDGGVSENGEPYLAMEYVEGRTVTEHCEGLSITDKLNVFLKICSAVSYAHANLVVHRDLKPGNILVTAAGEPKLLDFGLAKVFEGDGSAEQTRLRAFTPAYASPEQILGGRISTASDQYSLGVILYELLTGRKPFDLEGRSLDEIVRSLETGQALSPSAAAQTAGESSDSLPADLDNITLKALRREPERRYTSVEAFADDIRRYLDGRPVTARPNTLAYRASRFVRRHRTPVAAAAIVLIAVIAGVTVSLWQAAIARAERDRAERRFQEVRQLSRSFLFEIAPKMERLQGSTETRELLVRRSLEYLDGLAAERGDEPDLMSELALAYQKVGDLQGNPGNPNLGDLAGAVESYQKAGSIVLELPESPEKRLRLAAIGNELGNIRFAQGEVGGAIAEFEAAARLYSEFLASHPDPAAVRIEMLENDIDHAHAYAINNQYEVAIPMYRRSIAGLDGSDATDREVRRLKTRVISYLGNALSWNGEQEAAEAESAVAVSLAEALTADFPQDPEILQTVYAVLTLASSNFEGIKNEASLDFAERAIAVARSAAVLDPANQQARQDLARATSRRGIVLALVGRRGEGLDELKSAERQLSELIEREPRNTVYLDDLATLHTRLGDAYGDSNLPEALAQYRRSAEVFEQIAGRDRGNLVARRDLAQALKSVGLTEAKLGQLAAARQSLGRAVEIVTTLRAAGAIGKWDEKMFAEMENRYAEISSGR